jgi:hypothetical protein
MTDVLIQWGGYLLGGGGILYLLVSRFVRTREQKGQEAATMIQQVSEAFEKTLSTVMEYSTSVIEKMKKDEEHSEARYRELETRYDKLERRFDYEEADHELLKNIVGKAVNCPLLKDRKNDECPVVKENQKRLTAKCKVCKTDKTSKQ